MFALRKVNLDRKKKLGHKTIEETEHGFNSLIFLKRSSKKLITELMIVYQLLGKGEHKQKIINRKAMI